MKIRVMATDGTLEDFETEAQARPLFTQKKQMVEKAKIEIKDGVELIPSANIHRCYHSPDGNNKPCEIIERVEAKRQVVTRVR